MDPWAYSLAAIVLFCIGFFGFTFNAIVIILMCKNIKQWTATNIILLNLVCSDFAVSILGNPFTLVAAISHKWVFGTTLCTLYGFIMALLGITSITTLTVLAYERYCLIKYPLSCTRAGTKSTVIRIIFIWTYSLALTTPPLFGWGAYVSEAANISCSVNWESKTFNATSYIVFLFVFGLVIPLNVITYSYFNIISTMKMSAIRLGRKNRAEKRINIMVAVMIFAFMLAWTPYSIFALLEQFGPPDLISPQVAVLPALIAKSSICYNPLIYVGLNPQLRSILQQKITKDTTVNETTINQLSQNDLRICPKIKASTALNENDKLKSIIEINDNDKNTNIKSIINSTNTSSSKSSQSNLNQQIINENNLAKFEKSLIINNNIREKQNIQEHHDNLRRLSSVDFDIYKINDEKLNNKNDTEMTVFIDSKNKLSKNDLYKSNIF